MKQWNITLKTRYQLAFAGAVVLLMFGMLMVVWLHDKKIIPSPNAPLSKWLGKTPAPSKTPAQPIEVAATAPSQEAPLAEFVPESAPQAPPAKPVVPPATTVPEPPEPPKPDRPQFKDSMTNAVAKSAQKPALKEPETQPASEAEAFPILPDHFEQAQEWMKKGKGPPLLLASYIPDEIMKLARKERGFIVAEGVLNGQLEKMLVLFQQEMNLRLIKLDSRIAPNMSSSGLNLRPNGPLAGLFEAVELCYAGKPAKLFFHPTAEVGSSIIRKQFAAIAAAGINDPNTVAVTDGDLLVQAQSVTYVVNSILLRSSKFIRISDPAAKPTADRNNSDP